LTYPRLLERRLNVLELVLGKKGLGVTSKQPAQHLLTRVAHSDSDLAEGGLERFVVAEAAASERLFDRVVEVVGLELGHPPRAVPPDAHRTQHVPLANPSSKEDGNCLAFAELRERLIQARKASHCALDVTEGQMPGRQRLGEPVRVYPLCFQLQDDPRSHDIASGKCPALRLKDAEVRELSDAFDSRARPIGEFVFG